MKSTIINFRSPGATVRMPAPEPDPSGPQDRVQGGLRRRPSADVPARSVRERRAQDEGQQRQAQLRDRARSVG